MSITLGGIDIDDNMYLSPPENSPSNILEEIRTVDGNYYVRVTSLNKGSQLTLGTQNKSGSTQGIWYLRVIKSLKALEIAGNVVELNYRGDIYNVLIAGMDMTPMYQYELESDCKRFVGTINLIEV